MTRTHRLALMAVLLVQAAVLVALWPSQVWALNPDGVSYLRTAEYLVSGQWGLVVTGYWSPLLSWLVAPVLALGAPPVPAVKALLALIALAYPLATAFLLRRVGVGPWLTVVATALAAGFAAARGYRVNPDLLSALPLALAVGMMASRSWLRRRGVAIGAGALLGAAYLAKAVMLPMSVVLIPAWGVLWAWPGGAARGQSARAAGWTLAGLALVAGSWVAVLSVDHGAFTTSTAGPIAHGMMGPPGEAIDDSGIRTPHVSARQYHVPPPGRILGMEAPRGLAPPHWSPAESPEALAHQGRLVVENAALMVRNVRLVERLATGLWALLAVALGLVIPAVRRRLWGARWWWPAVPAVGLLTIYLPVFAAVDRYVYPVVPLLLAVTMGAIEAIGRRRWMALLVGLVVLSYAWQGARLLHVGSSPQSAASGEFPRALAARLAADGFVGPLAAAAPRSAVEVHVFAMSLAYELGAPYYGNEYAPSARRLVESGTRLVLLPPGLPLADTLAAVPGARRIEAGAYALGARAQHLRPLLRTDLIVLPPRDVPPDHAQRVFDRGR